MKTLVVYYSRTGVTRTVAEALAKELQGDLEEIVDLKKRSGALGWFGSAGDAMLKRRTGIGPAKKDPAGYDLVVIGTPIWAFTMTPAVRTYLTAHREALKRVAFFCTMGGSGGARAFRQMGKIVGRAPVATLALIEKDVKANQHGERVTDFASRLAAAPA